MRLLLDENISPVVAAQVRHHRPDLDIDCVATWQTGAFLGCADEALLEAAFAEQYVLVTYDQRTIPLLLAARIARGQSHAGVLFVDNHTIANHDFGTLTRALVVVADRFGADEWQNRVRFLEKPLR